MARDKLDVMRADALLVNLLTAPETPSLGTIMEIAWAYLLQKPIIVAMTEDNVHHKHPMIRSACSIILPTLEEAIDVTIRMISPI
jgi:nucleoside 2-deoxyribosyltransferase